MESQTDQNIVKSVLNGDISSFEILFNRHHDAIYRYVLRILNFHFTDADDITAETFATAYRQLVKYNENYSFTSWLYRIAHNKSIDHIRHSKRNQYTELNEQTAQSLTSDNLSFDLDLALNSLPPENRSILLMVYREGVTLSELAQILNVSKNAATVRLHRYKLQAQKIIKKQFPHLHLP